MKKLLFTPGPLTTSASVKAVMFQDFGSRDTVFSKIVSSIRSRLLDLANVSKKEGYEAIIMQGAGTFGIEAVISSVIPNSGKLLILINGAYGERIRKITEIHQIPFEVIQDPENKPHDPVQVEEFLKKDPSITHISMVHCETTTGLINPLEEIGEIASKEKKMFIVDAMSSFGGIPIHAGNAHIDFLISSSNKCIEAVPGFSFIIARKDSLLKYPCNARSLSLDLIAQWEGLEKNGQFRFTPPTHSLVAFHKALLELEEEGGIEKRQERYKSNHQILIHNMRRIGFKEYLDPDFQAPVITSFLYPEHPDFSFEVLYNRLKAKGMIIYPGKLSQVNCFRIGNIGKIFKEDIIKLTFEIDKILSEMGVRLN